MECRNRAENIINRKVTIFYIETVLNFFFQLRKKISEVDRKKSKKKVDIFQNPKGFWIFFLTFSRFSANFRKLSLFFHIFFRSISEKIFFGVEKKSWVQFRCKKLRPFDLWCFRSDCHTPSWGNSQMKKYITEKNQKFPKTSISLAYLKQWSV